MGKLLKINGSHVYILVNELNRVKIGITKDIEQRKKSLSFASGSLITEYYKTKLITNAKEIETKMHKHFKSSRYIGEWFNIKPGEAKSKLIELKKEFKQDKTLQLIYSNKPKKEIYTTLGISKQYLNNINNRIGLNKDREQHKEVNAIKESIKSITITKKYKRIAPNKYYNQEEKHTLIKKWVNGVMIDKIIQD